MIWISNPIPNISNKLVKFSPFKQFSSITTTKLNNTKQKCKNTHSYFLRLRSLAPFFIKIFSNCKLTMSVVLHGDICSKFEIQDVGHFLNDMFVFKDQLCFHYMHFNIIQLSFVFFAIFCCSFVAVKEKKTIKFFLNENTGSLTMSVALHHHLWTTKVL